MRSVLTIPLAITWETFWHRRWMLLGCMLLANTLHWLVFAALRREGLVPADDPSIIYMHIMLMLLNLMTVGIAIMHSQGSPARLYTLPISASAIAIYQIAIAMLLILLESLASIAVMNLLFDVHWPLWGPAIFVAVALSAMQAVVWLTEKSAWIAPSIALLGAALGVWFKSRYGAIVEFPDHYWTQLTPSDLLIMFVVVVLACVTGTAAIRRNRCGEPPISVGILEWLDRRLQPKPSLDSPFHSALAAQRWLEWRRKGWLMPGAVMIGMVFGICLWLLFSRDLRALLGGFLAGGGFLGAVGLLGGLVVGNAGPSDASSSMGPFLATRPLTTRDMARTILRTGLYSFIVAWLIWAAGLLVVYLLNVLSHQPQFPADEVQWWYFPATIVGPWIAVGIGISVMLADRPVFFGNVACAGLVIFPTTMVISSNLLSSHAQLLLSNGVSIAGGVSLFLITVWLFAKAHQRLLIGRSTLLIGACGWAVGSLLTITAWWIYGERTIPFAILLCGLCGLIVVPLAAAPLALALNRTR